MKTIKNILGVLAMFIAMTTFHSCKDDAPVYEPAEKLDGTDQGVFFPETNQKVFELEPTEPTQITLKIARKSTADAATIPLTVELNTDDVFVAPATVNFAAGEAEKEFTVTFPEAKEGKTYSLRLSVVGDEYVNIYSATTPYVSTQVTRIKWEPVEEPMVYVDGTFSTFFAVSNLPMYVNAEKADLGKVIRYRFKNAYRVPTGQEDGEDYIVSPDEDGIFDGYPYNEPGDVDETKDYYTIIEVNDPEGKKGDVTMIPHEIGIDWGYGMTSIGSIYGYLKDDKASFPLGELKDGVITFPANSLFISMASLLDAAKIPAGTQTVIYMTKDAYLAANMKIDDFNKVEYTTIEGEVGEFHSDAYSESWNQTLSKAVDIDEENEESEYKNLYFLPDLYAEGFGVAFYYDEVENKLSVVDNQKIGTQVFGKDIYVSQSGEAKSSLVVNDKGVSIYTLGLMFHYKDGTVLGNFAEKFFYSEKAVTYAKTDFIGDFTMTGISQFGADPANMKVKIAEGAEPNTFEITGINLAEKVIATFDETKSIMSIAPQKLADLVTPSGNSYDITLITTADGAPSTTASLDFTFNMEGKLALTASSEADGYLLNSTAAGGFVDGYYDILFTRIVQEKASVARVKRAFAFTVKSSNNIVERATSKTNSHNFRIQGKFSPKTLKNVSSYVRL